jgi:hypothetical protein
MGKRVATPSCCQKNGRARVGIQIGGMPRQVGDEQERGAVEIGRNRHERRERAAGVAIDRRERSGPHGPEQVLCQRDRIEPGGLSRVSTVHESTKALCELVI